MPQALRRINCVGRIATLIVFAACQAVWACSGDCNADGAVDAAELELIVAIHFGDRPAGACLAADENRDGQVSIAELIGSLQSAVRGCEPAASPTANAPATPTPTWDSASMDEPFSARPCTPTGESFVNCSATSGIAVGLPYIEIFHGFRLSFEAFCSAGYLHDADGQLPDLACASMEKGLRLYQNRGQFQFEDVTIRSGLGSLRRAHAIIAVAFGDLDGDGEQDLIAAEQPLNFDQVLLDLLRGAPAPPAFDLRLRAFRNHNGSFTEVTEQWGLAGRQSSSVPGPVLKLADINHDGRLDIALNLLALRGPTSPLLFVSRPDGKWDEAASEVFGPDLLGNAFAFAWTDIDLDGEPDFLSVNNAYASPGQPSYPTFLLRRQGSHYERQPIEGLVQQIAAMGAAAIDLDGDGWMELLITNIRSTHVLKHESSGNWTDLSQQFGLANQFNIAGNESSGQFVGFTPALIPVDGQLGVILSAGTDGFNMGAPYMKLFSIESDRFTEMPQPIAAFSQHNGEGMTRADFDGDGCPDFMVAGHSWQNPATQLWIDDPPLLIWNRASLGTCLSLGFRTQTGNPFGIGTIATVEAGGHQYSQALYATGSEYGDDEPRMFFPVAAGEMAHVTIRWPSGSVQTIDLPPGRHVIREP